MSSKLCRLLRLNPGVRGQGSISPSSFRVCSVYLSQFRHALHCSILYIHIYIYIYIYNIYIYIYSNVPILV